MNEDFADDAMTYIVRAIEFDRLVQRWCAENDGCREVPCVCADRFKEPVWQSGGELVLTPKIPERPRPVLELVWSRD